MISSTFPYPPTRGGTEVRTFNLLTYLRSHAVTLVTQADDSVTSEEIENLRPYVDELIIFPIPGQKSNPTPAFTWIDQLLLLIKVLGKAKPPSAFRIYSPEMQSLIDTYIASGRFDVVTCEHGINEVYIRPEFRKLVKVVLNAHSSRFGWTQSLIQSGVSSQTWLYRLYLHWVLRPMKPITAPSFRRSW
jgi:polysaccharide biosynthesis protein PslH